MEDTELARTYDVIVVLSGAGARGAFQAGALAELLPALAAQGVVPEVVLGTSAGAINAALWGSLAHHPTEVAAKELVRIWEHMSHRDVFRPLLLTSVPRLAVEFAAGALLNVGGGTRSLFDTTPLHRTAHEVLDTEQLAYNIADGHPAAVGVVATRLPPASAVTVAGAGSGRSVLFLHEQVPVPRPGDPRRAQDVAPCHLDVQHVLASAAIPVAFPPERVTTPCDVGGWYVDGGVRLNTPLRPAVALGANTLIVISATSTVYADPFPPNPDDEQPDVDDAAAEVMHAVMADRMVEDLITLRRTNRLARSGAGATNHAGVPYREIRFLEISPEPGEMGARALEVYRRKTQGLGRVKELDNLVLGQLLRGAGDSVGRRELLSYLFFDEDYFRESIDIGREAALRALARGWQT